MVLESLCFTASGVGVVVTPGLWEVVGLELLLLLGLLVELDRGIVPIRRISMRSLSVFQV